jgi:anti-sigma factor RsiW
MMVTRDVIYDLLPSYFAGEVSPDTRALVDGFLRDDPEFARMLERFRKIMDDRQSGAPTSSPSEKEAFDRARSMAQKESELRGYVVAFALAALFVPVVMLVTGRPLRLPFFAMSGAFLATSLISAYQLVRLRSSLGLGRRRPVYHRPQ